MSNVFTFSPLPGSGDISTASFHITMSSQTGGQQFSGSSLLGSPIIFTAVNPDKYNTSCIALNSANVAGPATNITVNTTVTIPVPLAPILPQPVIS